jgi:hypothetical protein
MKFWFIVLLLGSGMVSASAQGLPEGPGLNQLGPGISQRNQESVLKYLRPALMVHGGAGRIYYSTVCASEDGPLPFPEVNAGPPSKRTTGVTAVREIFKNDKRVRVSQDRSGMIRVAIGQPASALLQTRIGSVKFRVEEQYNGELAIWAIFNSKEVEAAMRQLGLDQPVIVFGGSINVPEKGVPLPHLPASIKNVMMDEALDVIARTFGGIVIYETCGERGGKRLVSLDFVQVAEL